MADMGSEPDTAVADAHEGPIKVNVGQLKFAMRAAGFKPADLARRTGISPSHLSRVLSGDRGVSGEGMDLILAAFDNRITFGELRAN
jgi:transcriptional regulator with XRE-family HTH domain